jgi:hypothetical protein
MRDISSLNRLVLLFVTMSSQREVKHLIRTRDMLKTHKRQGCFRSFPRSRVFCDDVTLNPWCYGAYKIPCVLTLVCSTHITKLVYSNTRRPLTFKAAN